jgi:hypothetical protein
LKKQLGHTEITLELTKFLNDDKFIYNIKDYLLYKGFFVKVKSSNAKVVEKETEFLYLRTEVPIEDSLFINWPKG